MLPNRYKTINELLNEKTGPLGFHPGPIQTCLYSQKKAKKLEKKRDCTISIAKTKGLISCAVTATLFLHKQKSGFLMSDADQISITIL